MEFLHLGEIPSIFPETVRVMALTATATITTQKFIIRMQSPEVIYIPPIKDNIIYAIIDKPKSLVIILKEL